jgi:hypothetical protein
MALLVFLARPARARIVATYLRRRSHRFWRLGLRSASLKLQILLLLPLPPLNLPGFIFRLRRLYEEQESHRFLIDAIHQIIKKRKRFFLEFDERILLRIPAQPNAFLQMIEAQQMIFPLRVHDIEQDAPLEPTHHLRAKKLFLLLVSRVHLRDQRVRESVVIQRGYIDARRFRLKAELIQYFVRKLRHVPLIGMQVAWALNIHQLIRDLFRLLQYEFFLIRALENRPTQRINRLALLVHHIVVFE